MVRWLIILLTGLLSAVTHAQTSGAYIKLSLETDTVYMGDTVVLDVESTGLLDELDLSPLTRHATLDRETTGTRIAVEEGKVVEIAIRRMDLTPKQPGILILGPIMAGPVQSNSVHVNVLNSARPTWQPEPSDLSISINATPRNPYVGQQVTLDILLKHRYPINSEQVTLPSLEAFSSREHKAQIRTTGRDNGFEVHWRYFIFPKRSGSITLQPLQWTGNITRSHSERADFERTSEALTLQVQPAANDQWWLPGKQVKIHDEWSQPPTSLRAGDELERTIVVTAVGNMSGQIPVATPPESRAILQTKLAENRTEKITESGVVATAEYTFRVRAQSPIPVFLDTVRVPWWNTTTNEFSEAIVPARRINVGLPDRADLLAELALQETGSSRFITWLKGTPWMHLALFTGAAISLLYLALTVVRAAIQRLGTALKLRRVRRGLLRLSHDPQRLYRHLQNNLSSHSGSGPQLQRLKQQLHRYLFNPDAETPDTAELKATIRKLQSDELGYLCDDQVRRNTGKRELPLLTEL